MVLHAGMFLISTPSLEDTTFDKVVIFIAEHNSKGAMGFIINQLFEKTFNELVEFKQSMPFAIYAGGPVENDKLFFIHQRPDLIAEGTAISNAIYLGGNFKQAVASINNTTLLQNDIKLFIGYCGWDPNQLEEEIAEGSWQIVDVDKETIFTTKVTSLWDELCK
jgi:putative transcriptional regulator